MSGRDSDDLETAPVAQLDAFLPFRYLAPEIRLMIWEETWPEPRVIRAAHSRISYPGWDGSPDNHWRVDGDIEDLNFWGDNDHADFISLRPECWLSTWLQSDSTDRSLHRRTPDEFPDPIALRICHESRAHTLGRFVSMRHSKLTTTGFYLDPRSDVLGLDTNVMLDPEIWQELRKHYGKQLDRIENAIVEENQWHHIDSQVLCILHCLRVIHIFPESNGPNHQPDD